MTEFNKMAKFYDTMYSTKFCNHMADYTLRILEKFGFEPESILDVCCGTGTALLHFSNKGYEVSGLDRSRGMLDVARKKLRGRNAYLYQRSLPRFEIIKTKKQNRKYFRQYDLATSYFDSLNFMLTERDLKAAFRTVYRHIRPGGWFIFDMNTINMFKVLWNEHPWVGVKDDMIWIMRSEFLKNKSKTRLKGTFLSKQGRDWQRYDELLYERAYPNKRIKAMLREVGFQIKGYYQCLTFNPVSRDSKKFCAAVRKPMR